MITEESVREAIDTARIEDVVGDFVNLRRRGNNYTGLCPFHNEKTPSFNVNPARNIYKCFGCGQGGDSVKFLMELEQLSFPDAIKWIAGKYNLKLEEKEVSQELRQEMQERDSLLIVNDFARSYFADQLLNTDEGRSIGLSYFKQRGFRRETLETFGLGYAPATRDGLLKAAVSAGHKAEKLGQLGLVRNGRDFFYDRVMFTIHDLGGKPIAFAGRILKKDVRAPKYVNSPESEVYHKSDVLYGMHQARQSVRKLDNVYMVEGYTDVISLHQNGIKNVVATSGTSLTVGQAKVVKRFTENVSLLYDGDKAGLKAALRGVDVLLEADLNVRVIVLPQGHDPDSYMQEVGTTAFEEYLERTRKDFLFFKADLLLEEAGTDVAARTEAIRGIGDTLALVSDPLKRAGYLQQFSGRLKMDESLLVNLVNKAIADRRVKARKDEERVARAARRRSGNAVARPPSDRGGDDGWEGLVEPGWTDTQRDDGPSPSPPPTESAPPVGELYGHGHQERFLLYLLIRHGHQPYDEEQNISVAAYLTAAVADLLGDFDVPAYRDLITTIMAELRQNGKPPLPEWYSNHANPELRKIATEALATPYTYSEQWKERYHVLLSQKYPEENQRLSADAFLHNFLVKKIDRKLAENERLIQQYEADGNLTKLDAHLRVQDEVRKIQIQLAGKSGTVVLKR